MMRLVIYTENGFMRQMVDSWSGGLTSSAAPLKKIAGFTETLQTIVDDMKDKISTETRILEGTDIPDYKPLDVAWTPEQIEAAQKALKPTVIVKEENELSSETTKD